MRKTDFGTPGPMLEVEDLTVRVGRIAVLEDIGFTIDRGAVVGLIGPGGAGKSALLDAICGLLPVASGRMRLGGRPIESMPPHRIARLGVARTFTAPEPLPGDTVLEALATAVAMGESGGILARAAAAIGWRRSVERSTLQILRRTGLAELADHPADGLPPGYRNRLDVGRALASRPRLLLLDSPLQGLSRNERSAFGRLVLEINGQGVTVLMADHDLEVLSTVCSRVLVLERGRLIADDDPSEIGSRREVLHAFVGEAVL